MTLPIILVTCANGTTGKEVVKALSASGKFQVRAGVRDVAKGQSLFNKLPNVTAVKLTETDTTEAFEGIYGLYLVIAMPIPGDTCFPAWIKEAKRVGVQHLIFHSAATAEPHNPVLSNRELELYEKEIQKSEFPYTFLRPSFFHQNTEKQYIPMIKQGAIIGASNNGRFTGVDCRDIAAVAVKVFENPSEHIGKSYPLTTEILTDEDHARLLSKYLGKSIPFKNISREDYKALVATWGIPAFLQEILVALEEEKESELALPKTNEVETLLGRPGISFEQYISEFCKSYKENNKNSV